MQRRNTANQTRVKVLARKNNARLFAYLSTTAFFAVVLLHLI